MKTRFIVSALMLFCLACTNNKPLSDSEKQQITSEVKEVTAQIISAAEKADIDAILNLFYDSPDNIILSPEGKPMSFSEWSQMFKTLFGAMQSQKITAIAENYRVLDRTTVWYSSVSKAQINFKDSSVLMQDPWNSYWLYKKVDNAWKIAGITEWGHEEITKPAPLPKDLDQIELSKQMLGLWKLEIGDTVIMFDQQPFGKGQVVSVKTSVKGKPVSEQRQLWSLDRVYNRMTFQIANKDGSGMVASLKFNTPTTYTTIPYNNVSNPAYAPFRIDGEFPDPNTYVEKVVINNEVARTFTYKRIK